MEVSSRSSYLEEVMQQLEWKVELAGLLAIINIQFPHGGQSCAQKVHF